MDRSRLTGFRPETEFKQLLDKLTDLFQRGPNLERRTLMALNANVQRLITEVAQTRDLSKSIVAGQDLLAKQIADLKSQLASIVPGEPVDQENLTAINAAADDLDATNEALRQAIPAQAPPTAPLGDQSVFTAGTQPVTHDAAGNEIAVDAPGQPGQDPIKPATDGPST